MKKLISIILISTLTVGILAGCDSVATSSEKSVNSSDFVLTGGDMDDVQVLIDNITGCKYLQYDRGIAPYYDEEGKVQGCKNTSK